MEPILTAEQARHADHQTSVFGLPSMVLMERAAMAAVDELLARCPNPKHILIVAGAGNNGGDGAAMARLLDEKGFAVDLYVVGTPERFSEQMKLQMEVLSHTKVCLAQSLSDQIDAYDVVVDAIFGIGLQRNIEGRYADVIKTMNQYRAIKIAVDMPSGIHSDTGQIMGCAFCADVTVTFGAKKPGLLLNPGKQFAGHVICHRVGIFSELEEHKISAVTDDDLSCLVKRDETGNKGTFGKVLIVAGSDEMFGAAYLAADASLSVGVGMVRVLTAETNRTALATLLPESLISTYQSTDDISEVLSSCLSWCDAALIGPGIGTDKMGIALLDAFIEQCNKPMVLDADALNIMSQNPKWWGRIRASCFITPHIMEMHRISGEEITILKEKPLEAACDFSYKHQLTCLLKDAVSVIAEANGNCWINTSGNSALATAGSGDVLAGILVGILVYKKEEISISPAAVAAYLHGKIGELAGEQYGKTGVRASMLSRYISQVLYS